MQNVQEIRFSLKKCGASMDDIHFKRNTINYWSCVASKHTDPIQIDLPHKILPLETMFIHKNEIHWRSNNTLSDLHLLQRTRLFFYISWILLFIIWMHSTSVCIIFIGFHCIASPIKLNFITWEAWVEFLSVYLPVAFNWLTFSCAAHAINSEDTSMNRISRTPGVFK